MNHSFKEMFIKNVSFVYSYHYYQFEKIIKIDNIVYIVEYFRLYITTGCSGKIVFIHNPLQPIPRLHISARDF